MRMLMLILRRITACLLGLIPVVLLVIGIATCITAVRAHDPAMYSIRDNYVGDAVTFTVLGLIGLFGCHRLWRAGSRKTWALVPIAVLLYAIWFPFFKFSHHGGREQISYHSTTVYLASVAGQLTEAAKESGHFACESYSDPFNSRSMFMQHGHELPYVVQCVANATGPITGDPPQRPGIIVVATSPDQKKAWFAATVLPGYVSRHARWLTRDGKPLIIAQQLNLTP